MIDAIAVRRTPTSGIPKPPAKAGLAARAIPSMMNKAPARYMNGSTHDTDAQARLTSTMIDVAESISLRYTALMPDAPDNLIWKLGARMPGHDYRIFTTGFVEATHPRTGARKQFSLIDCADWINVIALTRDGQVVLIRQFRPGTNQVYLEIPGGMIEPGEDPCAAAA